MTRKPQKRGLVLIVGPANDVMDYDTLSKKSPAEVDAYLMSIGLDEFCNPIRSRRWPRRR